MFGTDTFAAYCPDGSRGGAAHDPEHWVGVGPTLHHTLKKKY